MRQKTPERTCVGCRGEGVRAELVRLARGPDGAVVVDYPPRLGGRGAWVHASAVCIGKAVRKGALSRSFGEETRGDAATVLNALRSRIEDRVLGIISSGRGARRLAAGTEAVREAIASGEARLVGFALDARGDRASIDLAAVRASLPRVDLPVKERLGRALGRPEVGVVAVTDARLAAALARELSILSTLSADPIEANP